MSYVEERGWHSKAQEKKTKTGGRHARAHTACASCITRYKSNAPSARAMSQTHVLWRWLAFSGRLGSISAADHVAQKMTLIIPRV